MPILYFGLDPIECKSSFDLKILNLLFIYSDLTIRIIRIVFGSQKMNEYEYRIPLFGPNNSNIRIIRIIRSNTDSVFVFDHFSGTEYIRYSVFDAFSKSEYIRYSIFGRILLFVPTLSLFMRVCTFNLSLK